MPGRIPCKITEREGKVTGLRARGGFEIEMSWEGGRLASAVVHSKAGLPCKVVYRDKIWHLTTDAGSSYPLNFVEE